MAQARKRRRPTAGPPPVRNPKRAAAEAAGTAKPRDTAPRRRPGEPVPPSFKGVLVRAGLVASLFYLYLVFVPREETGPALAVTALAFLLMIPLGLVLDRWRYRMQMRRYTRERAARSGR